MDKPGLRIFSYLPNPRIFKATIAGRLGHVDVEVRGAAPTELADWLWDFDAHPLDDAGRAEHAASARQARTGFAGTLYKTDSFLVAHPYGTVPAAFSSDGATGIFESNSIMRAVARLGTNDAGLYGTDPMAAARIDSFLDVSLIFARDSQLYLLAMSAGEVTPEIHRQTGEALDHWLQGIDRAVSVPDSFIAGAVPTLADICFACEMVLLANERARGAELDALGLAPLTGEALGKKFPHALRHYDRLCAHPAFAPDIGPYLEKLDRAAKARRA